MITANPTRALRVASLILVYFTLSSQTSPPAEQTRQTVPAATIVDKIRGGLLGQMLGNLNGIPHEFKYFEEPGNVKNYIPSLPDGARTDDDTDFEWVYILEMQKNRNVFLPYDDITTLWKERINRRIWCSNRYARHLMDVNIKPPVTGYESLNPWAGFNISGSFLSETFGLIAPAMPQTAAKIGLHYTRVAIDGEPAQTTQLFTSMIAEAFLEDDINKILDAGTAALDPQSKTLRIISDIRQWHREYPKEWKETRRRLKEKYTLEGGRMRDNNGTELNTGATIAALLYGEGDFAETLKMAFNFGWDADNTAAAAGTIVGVTYGYRRMLSQEKWQIVDRYRNTTRDNMPTDETITSFADRLVELFEMVNEQNGGGKRVVDKTVVYEIPRERPAPVAMIPPPGDQKQQLREDYQSDIVADLLDGNRQDKARAAYLAVNLDMASSLSDKYPGQWKEATYELSGYWKIINNIFFGDFQALTQLKEKFVAAGFKKPSQEYSDNELYHDPEVWKDPAGLY